MATKRQLSSQRQLLRELLRRFATCDSDAVDRVHAALVREREALAIMEREQPQPVPANIPDTKEERV